ncbi:MAG: hypothetical protein LBT09_10680 [Planctomycetaceae bacterium]|nr:hypothetical protein [Planctomycetaceae bacterium]
MHKYSVAVEPHKVGDSFSEWLQRLICVQIKIRLTFVQTIAPVDMKFKM